jgi:hypothetical protein
MIHGDEINLNLNLNVYSWEIIIIFRHLRLHTALSIVRRVGAGMVSPTNSDSIAINCSANVNHLKPTSWNRQSFLGR